MRPPISSCFKPPKIPPHPIPPTSHHHALAPPPQHHYPEAQALAVSLINAIEYHLGERLDLDAPGRRRIARALGVVYINADGSVDEEATPITPPPNS